MRPAQRLLATALLTALPLLSPQLAHATAAAPSQKQVLDRFITSSNYGPQLPQLPLLVREEMARSFANTLSSARYQELTTRLLDSFEAERTKRAMVQQLSLGYDSGRYRTLIQKLESGSIRKLRDMERASHEPVARLEMQHFIARLPDTPLPPKREALIKELLAANGAVESNINTRIALNEVMRGLMADAAPEKSRATLNDSLEQSRRLAESLRPAVAAETLATALYTYRNASDEELKQYIEFYNSAAGQWFKLTQQNGWLGALRNIGRDIAWKMQHAGSDDVQTALEDELGL